MSDVITKRKQTTLKYRKVRPVRTSRESNGHETAEADVRRHMTAPLDHMTCVMPRRHGQNPK